MISDLLCAVRDVEGAHRFSFFAREVDMLITWGNPNVQPENGRSWFVAGLLPNEFGSLRVFGQLASRDRVVCCRPFRSCLFR